MKTLRISSLVGLFLFVAVSFTACKKDAEPNPELSARVVGNYKLTALSQNGKMLSLKANTTGTMNVVRESATSVLITVVVTNGDPANDIRFSNVSADVEDTGNGNVELVKGNTIIGTGGNNTLSIYTTPNDGSTPFDLIGTK